MMKVIDEITGEQTNSCDVNCWNINILMDTAPTALKEHKENICCIQDNEATKQRQH